MQTGDGLLARIRLRDRRMSPSQLAALAELAQIYGNGLVEVTARGNLQVRGLLEDSSWPFAKAVSALLSIDTGLVVDLSPLAGEDPLELADPRPLAETIGKAAAAFAHRLGPKVSVVVDGAGQIPLASLKADIRLQAIDTDQWAVSIGGETRSGDCNQAIALTLQALGDIAALGPLARAIDLFSRKEEQAGTGVKAPTPPETQTDSFPAFRGKLGGGLSVLKTRVGHTNPITLPFGAAHSTALIALAGAATAAGVATLRLAPDHRLLLDDAPPSLIAHAAALGLVTGPSDPRLRISACIGSAGCRSGHIAARDLAMRLAPDLPANRQLHVSGCAKGCAHPRSADLTLVGSADGIGLVIDGRASDTPSRMIDEPGLPAAVRTGR